MFGIGKMELVIILIIVIILFGASRLPAIGKGLGLGIKNFRKTLGDKDSSDEEKEESE